MKIKKRITIEQEIEVDVTLQDFFDHLQTMPINPRSYWTLDAINTAIQILRRVPAKEIEAMHDSRKRLFMESLYEQAERFRPK